MHQAGSRRQKYALTTPEKANCEPRFPVATTSSIFYLFFLSFLFEIPPRCHLQNKHEKKKKAPKTTGEFSSGMNKTSVAD